MKGFGFITWSLGHLLSILTFGKSEFAKDLIQAGKDMMSGEAMKNSVSDGVSKGMEESKKFQITSDNKGNVLTIHQSIPVGGIATLTLSIDVFPDYDNVSDMVDAIEAENGIHYVKILSRE